MRKRIFLNCLAFIFVCVFILSLTAAYGADNASTVIDASISIVLLCLGAVVVASILILSGVALGAYAVFKAKRDSYEPFFGQAKGDSFIMDDDFNTEGDVKVQKVPKPTQKANDNFVAQFAKKLTETEKAVN